MLWPAAKSCLISRMEDRVAFLPIFRRRVVTRGPVSGQVAARPRLRGGSMKIASVAGSDWSSPSGGKGYTDFPAYASQHNG